MVLLLSFAVTPLQAQNELIIKPSKCVTLKRGNTCYQEVVTSWRSDFKSEFCLKAEHQNTPLKCWKNQQQGQYSFEFKSNESVKYQLIKMPENTPLASDQLSVKWVYNKRSHNSWRLF